MPLTWVTRPFAQPVLERPAHLGAGELERDDRVVERHDLVDRAARDLALGEVGAQAAAVLQRDVGADRGAHRVGDQVAERALAAAIAAQSRGRCGPRARAAIGATAAFQRSTRAAIAESGVTSSA